MKSLVIFIQRMFFWFFTYVAAFFGGMLFMQHLNDEVEKKQQETEGVDEPEDSMYLTRDFNAKTSKNWSPDMAINQFFLRQVESYANEMLRRRGHVFLNEIYDELGLKRTSHGAIAGWLFRDNVLIAFTPREPEPKPDDINITLEFDYDGVIYDRLVIL